MNLRPDFFAAARNDCFSFFVVATLVPSTVGGLESSTNQARGDSFEIQGLRACGSSQCEAGR